MFGTWWPNPTYDLPPAGTPRQRVTIAAHIPRLRSAPTALPALIGYWDRNQRNVMANDAYVDFFGITAARARGTHLREALGDAQYARHLPHVEGVLRGHDQLFDTPLTDAAGVDRHIQVSYLPDVVDGAVAGFYVLAVDVTVRVQAERARDDALRMLKISMDHAPFGKAVLTPAADVLQINPALCALLGRPATDVVGTDMALLVHPEDRAVARAELARLRDGSLPQVSSEHRYLRDDGSTIWLQRDAVLVSGTHGGHAVVVAQFQDVTARRRADAQLARLALTDPLTGLHNRHALTAHLHRLGDVPSEATAGIVFIDIEGFKCVNDTFGHLTGDAVLAQAAKRLTAALRSANTAYRVGGDEFVVLVPDADTDVAALAEAIRAALTGDYRTPTRPVFLSATVGWTRGPIGDPDALLRDADADMYARKPRAARTRRYGWDADRADVGAPPPAQTTAVGRVGRWRKLLQASLGTRRILERCPSATWLSRSVRR